MFKYETHLHTYPASKCAVASVKESLDFYKELGYDGVFITNHFLDGNSGVDPDLPYNERIQLYFSDYEDGLEYGKKIGIKVFSGVELSYKGTDFLVYGLDKDWFIANSQIMDMKKSEELVYMIESGALVIQAHPFREARYIDHIRLFPRCVQGVEVLNASRPECENEMAQLYARHYSLIEFAGSDNHIGNKKEKLAGVCSQKPVMNETEFVNAVKNKEMHIFSVRG